MAENAALRQKLAQPVQQRVIEDVVAQQVREFLSDARQRAGASARALTNEENGSADEARIAVTQLLQEMCEAKAAGEQTIATLYSGTITPLNDCVRELGRERETLRARVAELELLASSEAPPPLVAELERTRSSEAVLLQQLREVQENGLDSVAKLAVALQEAITARRTIPDYTRLVEGLKDTLRDAMDSRTILQVQLDEQSRRHAVEQSLLESFLTSERELQTEKIALLQAQLDAAAVREEKFVSEKTLVEQQLLAAREEVHRHMEAQAASQDSIAAKRTRLETHLDEEVGGSSVRGEMIKFWYDGRSSIAKLQRRIDELKEKEAALRVSQGRVAQLERSRTSTTSQLVAVATEMDRVREENQRLRVQCAGVEVERDQLLASLAMAVQDEMSAAELRDCCRMIREAASRQAAASATVVVDPAVLQQAKLQAQQLKNEVAQLQRQKEKLLRFITLREERVHTLMQREALLDGGQQFEKEVPVAQLLEMVAQCARDIFTENEIASRGILGAPTDAPDLATLRHGESFQALSKDLAEARAILARTEKEAQSQVAERHRVEVQLETIRGELEATVRRRDEALASAEQTNTALLSRTAVLNGQVVQLEQQYAALSNFLRLVTGTVETMHHLLQTESKQVGALRQLVRDERQEVVKLVRAESAQWSTADAVAPIIEAVTGLRALVEQAVQQHRAACDAQQTDYIVKVVYALQGQEERVTQIQQAFAEASQQQAQQLAERIVSAQSSWDAAWRQRCEEVEAEKELLVRRDATQQSLSALLERVVLPNVEAAPTSLSSSVVATAPSLSATAAAAAHTLEAIDAFVQAAMNRSAQPTAPPPPSLHPAPVATTVATDSADVAPVHPVTSLPETAASPL